MKFQSRRKREKMKGNMKLYKIKLREKYRQIRENLKPFYQKIMDEKILKKLTSLRKYKNSDVVFTYISKSIEVDTYGIIRKCWKDGKKVAAPACDKETRTMKFYFINSFDDLEKGTFGLLEPNEEKCKEVRDFSSGLCIVPGFAFDFKAYRLGYGYGYYDRFLQHFGGTTVGICYSNCITQNLPHGRYDKPVDIVVTNSYIKEFNYR